MKATQYITSTYHDFSARSVYPTAQIDGIMRTRRLDAVTVGDFSGFGVAITDSSCYNLWHMPKGERAAILENLYGKDGLGLSIGRLTVGASDYSAELYSYDDTEGDLELKHFSIDRDKEYIIPVIKEILKINPDLYLYASPWSPPGWMKSSGSLCGGEMRREFIGCYADYIVRFIKEYAECGIRISAITPQNEPETDQGGRMPACIWSAEAEAEFILALREKLTEAALDVKILIHDHNFGGWKRAESILSISPAIRDACDGVAFHYYEGTPEDAARLRESYPDLSLHFTEGGPRLQDNYGTDWCKWGILICRLLSAGYKSFTGWNLMLDQNGGPKIGPFACGGLVTISTRGGTVTFSGQYRALEHFSKFLRSGALVYRAEQESFLSPMASFKNGEGIPLQIGCAENEDGSIAYFIVNADSVSKSLLIDERGESYLIEIPPEAISTLLFENGGEPKINETEMSS